MVKAAGEVLLPEMADRLGAEIALATQSIGVKQLIGPAAQGAAQPMANRHSESCFGAFDQRWWDVFIEDLAKGPLACVGAFATTDLHGHRHAPGNLRHAMI